MESLWLLTEVHSYLICLFFPPSAKTLKCISCVRGSFLMIFQSTAQKENRTERKAHWYEIFSSYYIQLKASLYRL